MDFKRIETIFLIAFIGLNFFLLKVYLTGVAETPKISSNDANTETLEERLAKDKVTIGLHRKFSDEIHEGYYLSASETAFIAGNNNYRSVKNGKLSVFIGSSLINLLDEKKPENTATILQQNGLNIAHYEEYVYSKELSESSKQIVYIQKWNELEFIDDTAQLTFNFERNDDNRVNNMWYEQTHIENIEPLREKQNLCTEAEAVNVLYANNKFPADTTLKWTKLAYTRLLEVNGRNVYIPAWFVGIEVGKNTIQVERVNALTQSILTTNVSEVKNE